MILRQIGLVHILRVQFAGVLRLTGKALPQCRIGPVVYRPSPVWAIVCFARPASTNYCPYRVILLVLASASSGHRQVLPARMALLIALTFAWS